MADRDHRRIVALDFFARFLANERISQPPVFSQVNRLIVVRIAHGVFLDKEAAAPANAWIGGILFGRRFAAVACLELNHRKLDVGLLDGIGIFSAKNA
jgi:hypothetical protein